MSTFMRRWLIVPGCMLAMAVHAQTLRQWNFQVFLDDKAIGYHTFSVQQSGSVQQNDAETRVTSTARFDVKVLFINAYRYVHDDQELWRNACLTSMTATTDDNGKSLRVVAVATDSAAGLNVNTGKARYDLSGCVMSFAYWNPVMLRQTQLLNAQTGEYDMVNIKLLGDASVRAAGKDLPARRYQLTGKKLQIDLWYSMAGEWLALESTTENGRRLRYVLK
jgi:hypothetical protein